MTAQEYIEEETRLSRMRDADGIIEWQRLHYLEVALELNHSQWVRHRANVRWAGRLVDPEKIERLEAELGVPLMEKMRARAEMLKRK